MISQCPRETLHSVSHLFHFYLYLTWQCVFSLWFFKLRWWWALWPLTVKRELIFKRLAEDKSFHIDHSTKADQRRIRSGKKINKSYFIHWCECWIQSKGAKIDLLLQSVEQIYSVLHVWSLDLLLVMLFLDQLGAIIKKNNNIYIKR